MPIDRRRFLDLSAASLVASVFPAIPASPRFAAVAFDGFAIFDPRPIATLAEALFPGKGKELVNAWRSRQFEYQWLRAVAGQYADFWRTTDDALVFAASQAGVELSPEKRDRLMQAHLELPAWPDVPAALAGLRAAGVRLAFLSNMTANMLSSGARSARLDYQFEHVLSTDRLRTYKPDPRAYQMAIEAFGLRKEQILFVAFAGWDAAGARWFGYSTYWTNRLGLPAEELGAIADETRRDMTGLPRFVAGRSM